MKRLNITLFKSLIQTDFINIMTDGLLLNARHSTRESCGTQLSHGSTGHSMRCSGPRAADRMPAGPVTRTARSVRPQL
jgi:hypothetical protein